MNNFMMGGLIGVMAGALLVIIFVVLWHDMR